MAATLKESFRPALISWPVITLNETEKRVETITQILTELEASPVIGQAEKNKIRQALQMLSVTGLGSLENKVHELTAEIERLNQSPNQINHERN